MKKPFKIILLLIIYILCLPVFAIFPFLYLLAYFLIKKFKISIPFFLILKILFVILSFILWRPFIIAMWYLHSFKICLTLLIIFLILKKQKINFNFKNLKFFYAIFLSIIFFLLTASIIIFTIPNIKQDHCEKVLKNKRVKPLFTFCDANWREKVKNFVKEKNKQDIYFSDPRSIFKAKDEKYIYLGFGTQASTQKKALIRFNRIKQKIENIMIMNSIFRGIYSPKTKVFYLAVPFWKKKGIYALAEKNFKIINKTFAPEQPLFFALDEKENNLFVGEHYQTLEVFKIKNKGGLKLIKKLIKVSPGYLLFSEKLKRIYAGSALLTIYYLYYYDSPGFKRKVNFINPINFLLSFGVATGIALDEKENLLYVSYPLEGAIYIFNAKSLKLKGKIKTAVGVREIAYDEKRKLLFLGQYVKGEIEVLNVKNKKTVANIFIGRKIREIFYDKQLKKVFATSTNGFFEIDVSKF